MAQLYKYYYNEENVELDNVVISDHLSKGMDKIDTATIHLMIGTNRHYARFLKGQPFKIVRQTDSYVEFRGWISEVRFPENDKYNVTLKVIARTMILNQLKGSFTGDVMGFKGKITSVTHTPDYIGDTSPDFDDNDYTGGYASGDMAVLIVPGESATKVDSTALDITHNGDSAAGTVANVNDEDLKTVYRAVDEVSAGLYVEIGGASATAKASVVAMRITMVANALLDTSKTLTMQAQYYDHTLTQWTNFGDTVTLKPDLWAFAPLYASNRTFIVDLTGNDFLKAADDTWDIRINVTPSSGTIELGIKVKTLLVEIYSDMKYTGVNLPISSWDANDGMNLTVDPIAAGVDVGDTYVVGRKDRDVLVSIFASFSKAQLRNIALDIDANFDGYTAKNFAGITLMELIEYFCKKEHAHWWYDQNYSTDNAEGVIRVYKTSTLATEGSLREPTESDEITYNYDDKIDSHVRSVTVVGDTYKRGDNEVIIVSAKYPKDNTTATNESMKDLIHDDVEITSWTEAMNVAEGMFNHLNDDTISINLFPFATQTWIIKDRITTSLDGITITNETISRLDTFYNCGNNHITQTYHLGFQATSLEERKANHIKKLYEKINQLINASRVVEPSDFVRADATIPITGPQTFESTVEIQGVTTLKDDMEFWKGAFRTTLVSGATADTTLNLPESNNDTLVGRLTADDLENKLFKASSSLEDGAVSEANVSQHEAALAVKGSLLSDSVPDARIDESSVTQHEAALAVKGSLLTDAVPNARILSAAVIQHQGDITGLGTLTALQISAQAIAEYLGGLRITTTVPHMSLKDSDHAKNNVNCYGAYHLYDTNDVLVFTVGVIGAGADTHLLIKNYQTGGNIDLECLNDVTIKDQNLSAKLPLADYLRIGAANKKKILCGFTGFRDSSYSDFNNYQITNLGGSDSIDFFAVPLETTRGGLKLYITSVTVYLTDADANDYIHQIEIRDESWNIIDLDDDNWKTPQTILADNWNTAGHQNPVDCSGELGIIISLNNGCTTAGELDFRPYVLVEYYYG